MHTQILTDPLDTARIVAFYRAQASEGPHALLHDPYARYLADTRGQEIAQALPHLETYTSSIAARTRVYDEFILRAVNEQGVDMVLNLGSGLDVRPYRLALPSTLRWIEVDFTDILAYKTEKLQREQPICRVQRLPMNLTDYNACDTLFAYAQKEAKKVLVLTEGLLAYWTLEQVSTFASNMHLYSSLCLWATEFTSPATMQKYQSVWNHLTHKSASMRFAPPGNTAFFQQYGWHVAEFRSFILEALHLKLFPERYTATIEPDLLQREQDSLCSLGGCLLLTHLSV